MDMDQLDIDWEYVVERLDRILELSEEYLTRRLSEYQLDPEIFRHFIAFRWAAQDDGDTLSEVACPDLADHDELYGIDQILARLRRNTEQFVHSYPANNVLLWGERGSGKSSAIKGLLRVFAPHGLRMVEIRQQDLYRLPQITALLREHPYRFILFCDDLSFNEQLPGYGEIRALLKGGIEEPPGNILVYATSHRQPARLNDSSGEHATLEQAPTEGLALAELFGISLGFGPTSQETYLHIAGQLARQRRLIIADQELDRAALQWARERGCHSGRMARQFIDDLSGQLAMAGKIAPLSS